MKGRWMVDISIKSKIFKNNQVVLNGVVGQVNYSNWRQKSIFMNIQPITRQLPKGFCKRAFSVLITSHFKRLWNSEHQSPGHRLHHSDVPVHMLVHWEPQPKKASRRGQKSNHLVQIWRDWSTVGKWGNSTILGSSQRWQRWWWWWIMSVAKTAVELRGLYHQKAPSRWKPSNIIITQLSYQLNIETIGLNINWEYWLAKRHFLFTSDSKLGWYLFHKATRASYDNNSPKTNKDKSRTVVF